MPGTEPSAAGHRAFFDEDYRRLLAPFHSEADARYETAALRELLGLAQDDRILDLGCGWGRHLILLSEAGHDVIGVDLSYDLLRRVPRDTDSPIRRPKLAAADMRALPLDAASFDVVLNLATSIGLFLDDDDALAALRETRRVLRTGGRFLLEGMHREDIEKNFAPRARWFLDDGTEVRARRRWDPERGISDEVLRWRGPGQDGEKRHRLRIRTAESIGELTRAAGLTPRAIYGSWGGAQFGPDSPRFILVGSR